MIKEILKQIYIKYNLDREDIFTLKFGKTEKHIITRSGVEKIQTIKTKEEEDMKKIEAILMVFKM